MSPQEPDGLLTIRTIAMPADLNYDGDVFGGWLMAQMDLAGSIAARWRAGGRVATVAVDGMTFHLPMKVGDELSCYCNCTKIGRTSMSFRVEAWVRRRDGGAQEKVTQGTFTFVRVSEEGKPLPIPADAPSVPVR